MKKKNFWKTPNKIKHKQKIKNKKCLLHKNIILDLKSKGGNLSSIYRIQEQKVTSPYEHIILYNIVSVFLEY